MRTRRPPRCDFTVDKRPRSRPDVAAIAPPGSPAEPAAAGPGSPAADIKAAVRQKQLERLRAKQQAHVSAAAGGGGLTLEPTAGPKLTGHPTAGRAKASGRAPPSRTRSAR